MNKASGKYLCSRHSGKFMAYTAPKPETGVYGLFLKEKAGQI